MIDLYVGYGLFILYIFCVVMTSGVLWLILWFAGIGSYYPERETGIAGGRKWAVLALIVAGGAQWFLLKSVDPIIRVMWHSLPPLPFFG